ncbi:MAG: response regulator transcription factor [Chloroflexi bacterium]|nr:response regulator transcription factor [Chloroflexota bacterium]MCI0575606.1 response regulator transcription factor [Chloroflexota bacterium]MCI0645057.1 response regulator transcription factor [Chloroflexota bacterium]MCI0731893.1 response regulator transcription factor [Chloroflexota bacterium]
MKILIVEDDLALSDVLAFTLRRAGYEVVMAYDGLAALQVWQEQAPDLIVLDLNLPKLDGLAVCRQIRSQAQTPIIILSVRGGDEAVVQGLELGADDYVVKPFSPNQLVARVRAVLRRAGVTLTSGPLETTTLTLDRSRLEVHRTGLAPVRLTPLEARLLEVLMLNAGQVVSTEELIGIAWGAEGGDRTMLKQLVYRLRNKLEPNPSQPTYIETIPGVGYVLAEP